PAFSASRTDPNRSLRGTPHVAHGGKLSFKRSATVAFEIAVTFVLVCCAALFLRSFARLQSVDVGIDPSNVVAFWLDGSRSFWASKQQFFKNLTDRLRADAGVETVAVSGIVPLSGFQMIGTVSIEGTPSPDNEEDRVSMNFVGADYFRVFRIPLL